MSNCQTKLESLESRVIPEQKAIADPSFPIAAYIELTKPRILTMVLVTTTLGFFLSPHGQFAPLLIFTLVGTALTCGGAAVLNHYLERKVDTLMVRTRNRPIPTGVITPGRSLAYGITLAAAGIAILFWQVNGLAAFLALLSALLYTLVYTPLKKITWLNTPIGAIPGAIPPLIGWSATGELTSGAWILFSILFTWQHPHFYAIAWIFQEDYRRGGFKMLPLVDACGESTFRQTIFYSVLLFITSLLPSAIAMSGVIYFCGALALGLFFLDTSAAFANTRSTRDARRLLRATVVYLPLLLILIVIDGFFA